jgi:membrane protein implicated in regulation of membrane protease activity
MTWAGFYLLCFIVGFSFSALAFLLGGIHWHLPFHFHWDGHGPHLGGDVHLGHAGGPAHGTAVPAAAPAVNGAAHGAASMPHAHAVSPVNPPTLAAFLAWFGGTGYLLTRYSSVWTFTALGLSTVSGLIGGGILFLFMSKVLYSPDENMDPADYAMVGVLGRVCIPIREGGTGEIIYSQGGTRRVAGARSDQGIAIAKGTDVIVTRFEKGIAYVRLYDEMAGEETLDPGDTQST